MEKNLYQCPFSSMAAAGMMKVFEQKGERGMEKNTLQKPVRRADEGT
jgi:hypothetical protein